MKIDVSEEITFKTARSSGKGGQHVNKVETMVEGSFSIEDSALLDEAQKQTLKIKLAKKITIAALLQSKSQTHRSQSDNKKEVIKKINEMVARALVKEKLRIPTKPSRPSKEKRIQGKKQKGEIKATRRKVDWSEN